MDTLNIAAIMIAFISIIWNISIIFAEEDVERLSLFVPYEISPRQGWKSRLHKLLARLRVIASFIHAITAVLLICGVLMDDPVYFKPWLVLSTVLIALLSIRWISSIYWILYMGGDSLWCIEVAAIAITLGFYGLGVYCVVLLAAEFERPK